MIRRCALMALIIALTFVLASCGSAPSGGSSEAVSYKDMKSMVIDILKTEDAQKALQESAIATGTNNTGLGSRILSVQDQEQVRMAVKETILSPDYDRVIKTLMVDPRFAGEFATAVNKQNKQIHKDLLKDPSYQRDLIQVMKNPEMDKMILDVLQSTQYRKQVMTIMQESMSNPIFRLEILDLLKKAVQEELHPNPKEKVQKAGSEGQQGEGEGDGEGGDQQGEGGMGEGGG